MGAKIRMDQIISGIQKLWQNRRRADGLRVEYFPRIQCVAAQWRRPKFTVDIRRDTREFDKKNSIHVDVQRHFFWNKRQWTRMSGKRSTRIFVCNKIWKRTMVIHWSWFWKGVVFYERRQSTRSMGQIWREKMLLEFAESGCPINRATTPLSRSQLKSNGHGKLSIHFAADQETTETIFRIIVLQTSSVSTEQLRRCVKNMKPFTTDRGNRCGRAIKFLTRAKRDQDRSTFG